MSEFTVSVVVPTYNRAYCIAKTLDSVFAQTHQDFELLVVDDGSTDRTRELVLDTYGKDPRLRYLEKINGGVSSARNHGLRAATGAFVALLDSDDWWVPWKLELQVTAMQRLPHVGMIWTDMDAIDDQGVVTKNFLRDMYSAYKWFGKDDLFTESHPLAEVAGPRSALAAHVGAKKLYAGDIFSQMVMGNLVHTSTVLLRRNRVEKVGLFNEGLRHAGEDYEYHLRTCRIGPVAYADVSTIFYQRGRPDRITRNDNRIHFAQGFLQTIRPVIERERDRIRLPQEMIDDVLAEAHAWVGNELMERGQNLSAIPHLARSLFHKPYQLHTAGMFAFACIPPKVGQPLRRAFRELKGAS
ncbi:glycosyltransferase family 2 protein [Pendulispora albinea]|uniref:Glycosyltransferase n=1 Tax=Pendulispora albinea TaxID=2741071 RepID=A0ABZ2MBY4_9BACT